MDYATLKRRWAAWSKQTLDAELTQEVTDVVAGMISTDVKWLDNQSYLSIAADQGTNVTGTIFAYARPGDTRSIRSVNVNGFDVEQMTPGKLQNTYRTGNAADVMNYSVVGSDIWLAPGQGNLDLVLESKFPALVNDVDGNDLLDEHPDVYIHAGVGHIHRYFQDMEAASMSDQLYNVAVMKANDLEQSLAYGVAPSVRAG